MVSALSATGACGRVTIAISFEEASPVIANETKLCLAPVQKGDMGAFSKVGYRKAYRKTFEKAPMSPFWKKCCFKFCILFRDEEGEWLETQGLAEIS